MINLPIKKTQHRNGVFEIILSIFFITKYIKNKTKQKTNKQTTKKIPPPKTIGYENTATSIIVLTVLPTAVHSGC